MDETTIVIGDSYRLVKASRELTTQASILINIARELCADAAHVRRRKRVTWIAGSSNLPVQRPLILMVEDGADTREMYRSYFSFHAFRVSTAPDGVDVVRQAKAQQPDLVLMDLGLPRVDGWVATRRLKADVFTRHIPVLVLTGHADAESLRRAMDAGADACVVKPCEPRALVAKIWELLLRARNARRGLPSDPRLGPV